MASQVDLGPSKLAQWDASARAWLHAADKTFSVQQKQLMLIIDNLGYNLSSQDALYDTVLRVWCNALTFMEKIASGMSLSAEDSDIFFGLSAWHLYPDMTILGDEPKQVIQKDGLVPKSALVTVGLRRPQNTRYPSDVGITWTIPLSRLKHYGRPEVVTSNVGTSSGRASFEKLIQIALGSLVREWGEDATDLTKLTRFFTALAERCRLESKSPGWVAGDGISSPRAHACWSTLFADLLEKYQLLRDSEKIEFGRYMNLGRRRYRTFLGTDEVPAYFGLTDASSVMDQFQVEDQIKYIRDFVSEDKRESDLIDAVILYADGGSSGIASLIPQSFGLAAQQHVRSHRRWIFMHEVPHEERRVREYGEEISIPDEEEVRAELRLVVAGERSSHLMDTVKEPCGFIPSGTIVNPNTGEIIDRHSGAIDPPSIFRWIPSDAGIDLRRLEKAMKKHSKAEVSASHRSGWIIASSRSKYENIKFRLIGNTHSIAIYVPVKRWTPDMTLQTPVEFIVNRLPQLPTKVPDPRPEIVTGLILETAPAANAITRVLNDSLSDETLMSLSILSEAAQVYSTMPTATVDLTTASDPLHLARCFPHGQLPEEAVLAATFACICKFDSGINLRPNAFLGVMAISSNDVLYVCDALLEFPIAHNKGVRCVPGNIGKPGVCLLTSTPDLDVRDSPDDWKVINHFPFDGKCEDNFYKTSLHLQLTGAELPLDVGRRGNMFVDAMYVDAVVQVYDRGQWYTDINVMSLYTKAGYSIIRECVLESEECGHNEAEKADYNAPGMIITVDNWPEIVEPPLNVSVIRARGNWSARLAIACFVKARNYSLMVASEKICWSCMKKDIHKLGSDGFMLL